MLKDLVKDKLHLAVCLGLMVAVAVVDVGFRFSDAALGKASAVKTETVVIPKTDMKLEKPSPAPTKADTTAKEAEAEVKAPTVQPKAETEVKAPTVQPKAETEVKTPAVQPKAEAEAKTPAVQPKAETEVKTPAVQPKAETEVKTPAVQPKAEAEVKTPAVQPKAENEVKTPAVQPKAEAEVKTPAVQPKTEAEVKTPAVQPKADTEARVAVRIDKYGVEKEFFVKEGTVAQALKELGISHEGRVVFPALKDRVEKDMKLHVLGRYEHLSTETLEVPFETQFVDDNKLAYGKTEIVTAGITGKDQVTYKNVLRSGLFQKLEIGRKHVVLPKKAVVKRGTAQGIKTGQGYVAYKRKMVVEASAYTLAEGSGTGLTSIGIVPYHGIVAVDPRIIPYYTKMYIPGYGFAMAGDTGGAIVGHTIDLFMNSYYDAIQWGRRTIEIYIL